jgi:SAM-dependent methyltransferase
MANSFANLNYADFQRMAQDPALSPNEKIGFPDSYRQGFAQAIHQDILAKLTGLSQPGGRILDIGPGCAELPGLMIAHCAQQQQQLVLVDSAQMLALLPDPPHVHKRAGFYPDCAEQLRADFDRFDCILCYSVFHYIFVETQFWRFIDQSLDLLAPGGQMLIGDIPNVSKRRRFFASEAGVRFHQAFMHTSEAPRLDFFAAEHDKIDDAVILGVIMRARAEGCDAYWLPQPAHLPMANRREDILILKP